MFNCYFSYLINCVCYFCIVNHLHLVNWFTIGLIATKHILILFHIIIIIISHTQTLTSLQTIVIQ